MSADEKLSILGSLIKWAIIIFVFGYGMNSCMNAEWYQKQRREELAEARAAAIPHIIRDTDGCKVYAFQAGGREHYFTRCGSTVTTETTGSESCGKNCSRPTSELIVTKGPAQ